MAEQGQRRARSARVMAGLVQHARAEHYWQRQVWRAGGNAGDRPGPLEFDPDGFPIPQPRPAFVERVGRLLREG
jgi:hypothetical protein